MLALDTRRRVLCLSTVNLLPRSHCRSNTHSPVNRIILLTTYYEVGSCRWDPNLILFLSVT